MERPYTTHELLRYIKKVYGLESTTHAYTFLIEFNDWRRRRNIRAGRVVDFNHLGHLVPRKTAIKDNSIPYRVFKPEMLEIPFKRSEMHPLFPEVTDILEFIETGE